MSEEIKKKKHRLKDITFEHKGAHIALVGPAVGGPANRAETVLWKSKATDDISEEEVKQLLEKASEKSEVEKAKWYSEIRETLNELVREKYKESSKDGWLYLEDFNATTLVVTRDNVLFTVSYSLSDDGEYVLGNDEQEVEIKRIYIEKGVAHLTEEAKEVLDEGVYSLLSKALDNPETNERVVKHVSESLEKAKIKMQEEIQKAVDAAKAEAAAQLAAVQEELTKAKEIIAQVEAEKKAAVLKARQEAVAAFDKDGAEALVKATEGLADEAFEVILKSLKAKQEQLEQSDLFKQAGTQGAEAPEEESPTVVAIRKMAEQATK